MFRYGVPPYTWDEVRPDIVRVSEPLTRTQKVGVCPLLWVKQQSRILHTDEDDLIERYIEVAYDFLSGPEGWLGGCCLLQEDWECYAPGPVRRVFELPLRPFVGASVTGFDYLLSDGSYTPVNASTFGMLQTTFGSLRLTAGQLWPYSGLYDPRAYRIRFTAGYAPINQPGDVPSPIAQAMRMLVAHWIANREAVGLAGPEVMFGLRSLAGRYRVSPDHS